MNPWLDDDRDDETDDAALFVRRARAVAPRDLPSLAAVLAEVDAPRIARAERVERRRAWGATFAAAACVAALFTRAPGFEAGRDIVAETDAGPAALARSVARPEVTSASAAEACDQGSDEALDRSTCALASRASRPSLASRMASHDEAVPQLARVAPEEAPGTCSEAPASMEAREMACDRAMSCSAAHASP